MTERPTVCLILEGSYPYVTGGVSAWVHQLIRYLENINFVLYTISPTKDQPLNYELPANVITHKDMVLSAPTRSRRGPANVRALIDEIIAIHNPLLNGIAPEVDGIVKEIPTGYSVYADGIKSEAGWHLLTSQNQKKNPAYAFSDYFWAWKSAHDMMFAILGDSAPEADLYHPVSTGYAGLAALTAKIRKGKPFILTEHGLYHKEREMEIRKAQFIRGYQRDMWIGIYNNLSRLSYRYADLIIALFEHNRRLQIELGAAESKTRVIPNGIDVPFFSQVARRKKEGFHVGLVGRVVPIKDIKTFISMAKIVSETIPEAVFHCIGPTEEDPGYFEDCQILVESLKLSDRFIFTGRQDVREYYSFLDVLLLTSVREAQPLVILEAYCAGVPVVATRVGNVAELIDFDDRFIAPSKDPEKLAAGVRYIYEHPQEMEIIVQKNRDRVVRFYDRDKVFQTYGDLYLQHINASTSGEQIDASEVV
ncbi:MAG: GT4 family glycosyltransferase PelF [Spirochaetaceae bacterium]|nr:MAG: GT4 family glycosyltransferase PelF [Spirochaetaceae bacterium]